jgi:hypothetical protein
LATDLPIAGSFASILGGDLFVVRIGLIRRRNELLGMRVELGEELHEVLHGGAVVMVMVMMMAMAMESIGALLGLLILALLSAFRRQGASRGRSGAVILETL